MGLENIYSLESLGINEDADKGSIDEVFLQKFYETIEFKEGKYHVELPWHENILEEVPSNYHIALATMRSVHKRLERQGLSSVYGDVFKQYQREGIIEAIQVTPENFKTSNLYLTDQ